MFHHSSTCTGMSASILHQGQRAQPLWMCSPRASGREKGFQLLAFNEETAGSLLAFLGGSAVKIFELEPLQQKSLKCFVTKINSLLTILFWALLFPQGK